MLSRRAATQWHWLSGKTQCREGEAPAEPHPCRERFFDPRCAAKRWQTLTARTSVQRLGRSLALGWRNGANSANSRVSLRRNGYPAFSLLKISNHDLSSLKPKTPLNSQITTVSPSQPRPPKDFTRLFTEFQRTPMPLGGSLRYALAPWCAPPACGVSSALAGHFTRGLPPCGSFVAATRG
jgi:hypothetical protein